MARRELHKHQIVVEVIFDDPVLVEYARVAISNALIAGVPLRNTKEAIPIKRIHCKEFNRVTSRLLTKEGIK